MKFTILKIEKLLNKNNILLTLSVVIKFLSIGVALLVSRWQNVYFSPNLLSEFNITLAYLAIILGIINFGIPQMLYKYYSNNRDIAKLMDFWTTFVFFRGCSYIIGLIIILITYRFSGVNNLFMVLGVFSAQFILLADQSFRSVVDSQDKSIRFSSTDMLGKLILVFLLYSATYLNFISKENTLSVFIFISIITYCLIYILDFIVNKDLVNFSKISFSLLRKNFKSIVYLSLPTFFIVTSLDRIILGHIKVSDFELIGYSNGIKLLEVANVLPALVIPVLASRFSLKQKLNTSKKKLFDRYFLYTFLIASSYSLGYLLFSSIILRVIDPKLLFFDYSLRTILPFAICTFLSFFVLLVYNINIINHKEKSELYIYIIISTLYVISFLSLIPLFGADGAIFSHLVVYSVSFVIRVFQLIKYRRQLDLISNN